jgi:hypothetical protein
MSGDAANCRPFEAALGISRNACERQSHRQHCAPESRFHINTSLRPLLDNSAPSVFVPLTTVGRRGFHRRACEECVLVLPAQPYKTLNKALLAVSNSVFKDVLPRTLQLRLLRPRRR